MTDTDESVRSSHHGSVAASRLAAELGHFNNVRKARIQFPYRIHLEVSDDGLNRTELKTIREFGWDVSGFTIRSKSVSVVRSDQLVETGGEPA